MEQVPLGGARCPAGAAAGALHALLQRRHSRILPIWRGEYHRKRVLTNLSSARFLLCMGPAEAASPGDVEGVFAEVRGVADTGPVVKATGGDAKK